MEYGVVHFFPGGTKDQYERSIEAVHPGKDMLPKGQIYHVGGPTDGGWLIVAIFDSKGSWESFRDETLMPAMQKGLPGGFTSPPEERAFEINRKHTA